MNLHFSAIFERVKNTTNIKNFAQLAEFVGTTQSYVSRKKSANDFPITWAFKIGQEYNVSTDWLLTGENPKENKEQDSETCLYDDQEIKSILKKIEQWLLELKRKNPKRINWFECAFEDKFAEYKEWLNAKKSEGNQRKFVRSRDG